MVESEFLKFMQEPDTRLYLAAVDSIRPRISDGLHNATRSALKSAFMEGMKSAQALCDSHNHSGERFIVERGPLGSWHVIDMEPVRKLWNHWQTEKDARDEAALLNRNQ